MVRSLPRHSLIDRLVRGRAWIPVLGVLLAGLVTMQVEILKLGTSLGRSLEQTTTLQSENEALQARVATLADDQRIERLASGMGMVLPSSGMLTFVSGSAHGQLGKAIANIHSPDPINFAAQLAASAATAALIAPTTATTPGAAQASGQATSSSSATPGSTTPSTVTAGAVTGTAAPVTASTTAQPTATGPTTAVSPSGTSPTSATGPPSATGPTGPTGASGAAGLPAPSATGTQTGG